MVDTSLIREFEGFRSEAYPDPGTGGEPWTIGYGTTYYPDGSAVRAGDTVTERDAEAALDAYVTQRILPALARVPGWSEMSDGQQSALADFAYNLGADFYGADGFHTISTALRERRWSDVPDALLLYSMPGAAVHAGLLRRRQAEAAAWRGNSQAAEEAPVFEVKIGDVHVVVSHEARTASAFCKTADGAEEMWEIPVLTEGQGPQAMTGGDTPFGTYRFGGRTVPTTDADDRKTHAEYGVAFIPLTPVTPLARDEQGIGWHAGGSALGYPACMDPRQPLVPTLGCLRSHNVDVENVLVPLNHDRVVNGYDVYVTVGT